MELEYQNNNQFCIYLGTQTPKTVLLVKNFVQL